MVATSFYIPDTYYRVIPNPTTFSWNRKNFSLRKLLLEYTGYINDEDMTTVRTSHIMDLGNWAIGLQAHLEKWKNEDVFSITMLHALHDTIKQCDEYLQKNEKLVKLVLREHVQEVIKLLNEGSSSHSSDDRDDATLSSKDKPRRAFDELNSASPEERQNKLMDIYFTTVLHAVTKNCHESLLKQKSTTLIQTPNNRSMIDLAAADAAASAASRPPQTPPATTALGGSETPRLLVSRTTTEENASRLKGMPVLEHEVLTEEVWCTLIFRSMCWLLLHDFHKKDVQIPKSELYDSRLPVYIS